MLLIYDDEQQWATMTPEESGQMMKEYFEYSTWLQGKGWFKGGDPLQRTATAKTVRVRDGELQVTDGPFAETKEQLGGYYEVECEKEQDVIEAARRIPSARLGSIEVRPIMEIPSQTGPA